MQGGRNWRRVQQRIGGAGVGRGEARRPVEIVKPKVTERGGGDGQTEEGAEAMDVANLLPTVVRQYGRDGVLYVKIVVRFRVHRINRCRGVSPRAIIV